jgi:hypothetical protein
MAQTGFQSTPELEERIKFFSEFFESDVRHARFTSLSCSLRFAFNCVGQSMQGKNHAAAGARRTSPDSGFGPFAWHQP